AAGATGAATGWYNSLRMFRTVKWVPQSGGRQATPRLFAEPLLSPLDRDGEAINIARSSVGDLVFPDDDVRDALTHEEPWGVSDSWQQHLIAMSQVYESVDMNAPVADRVSSLSVKIADAVDLLGQVALSGASISASYETQLRSLRQGLEMFAEAEGL
ncbi:MAG: hypothetical protein ACC652_11145, partial [Acidimicrobiales bacterium]